MSHARNFGRLFSWVIAVAALGFFYSGEAFALCCKKTTTLGTQYRTTWSTTACSTLGSGWGTCTSGCKCSGYTSTGAPLTFSGSVINCIYGETQGTVRATQGNASQGIKAEWTEESESVQCEAFADLNNDGEPDDPTASLGKGNFALSVTFAMRGACIEDAPPSNPNSCSNFAPKKPGTNVSQAVCNNATGEVRYIAYCASTPAVEVFGTLTALDHNPPNWVHTKGCTQAPGCAILLGDFRRNKQGEQDPNACDFDFQDQTAAGGLPSRGVLDYKEQYAPGTFCAPDIQQLLAAGPGQRRMCHNNSFNGVPNPCAPEKVGGTLVTFTAGIDADDKTTHAALLDENQWRPTSTQSLGCNPDNNNLNSGNVPTVFLDSARFATATIDAPGSVELFVKGFPDDTSPAQRVFDVTGGRQVEFDGCRTGPLKDGVSQVICRHQQAWNADGTVDLGVVGTTTVNGKTFQFAGFAPGVKLSGSCSPGSFELP